METSLGVGWVEPVYVGVLREVLRHSPLGYKENDDFGVNDSGKFGTENQ